MNKHSKTEIILLAVVIIALVVNHFLHKTFYENYEGMGIELLPGKYPLSMDKPILVKDYPLKKHMALNQNTQNIWKDYPVFSSSSYAQRTNNVKYWSTPNNGTCSRAEFCGSMYANKKITIPPPPTPVPFDSDRVRVNYYASTD